MTNTDVPPDATLRDVIEIALTDDVCHRDVGQRYLSERGNQTVDWLLVARCSERATNVRVNA